MPSMNALAGKKGIRILGMGFPGSGKTGSLASLANAGYKLRIIDFDGNNEPLFTYVDKDKWGNIDIMTLEDQIVLAPMSFPSTKGTPKAFPAAFKLLDDWKTTDDEGKEVSLGGFKSWGSDTVLVVDGITGLSEAAMRYTLALQGRSPANRRIQDWGTAAAAEMAFIDAVTAANLPCHVIVFSHLKFIGAKMVEPNEEKGITPETASQMNDQSAAMSPVRLVPTALGTQMPDFIVAAFPIALYYEKEKLGAKTKLTIHTVVQQAVDVKVPVVDLPAKLEISDGLVTIFNKLNGGTK